MAVLTGKSGPAQRGEGGLTGGSRQPIQSRSPGERGGKQVGWAWGGKGREGLRAGRRAAGTPAAEDCVLSAPAGWRERGEFWGWVDGLCGE